jgi:hypothetical protein
MKTEFGLVNMHNQIHSSPRVIHDYLAYVYIQDYEYIKFHITVKQTLVK